MRKNEIRGNFRKTEMERWETHPKILGREATVEIVRRIVEDSDRLALGVLLERRRLFRLKEDPPLLLSEFLMKLRDRLAPPQCFDIGRGNLADCTYDLTLAKFSSFPNQLIKTTKSNECSLFATKVDCRYYYRAFLNMVQQLIDRGKIKTQLQEETYAGKVLQNLVYNNFFKSKKECKRHTPFSVRYTWNVNGRIFYLWYPSHMTARKFREWLEENIKDINHKYHAKEQGRIQTLINENLEWGYHISMDGSDDYKTSGMEISDAHSLLELHESQVFVNKLANEVAQKKVRNLHRLRPGIKKLGQKAVESLISQIFSDLSEGDYKAVRIVEQYGVSKATLSRFAGNNWFEQIGGNEDPQIPDLWKNTAEILAGNREFMETVFSSGVVGKLDEVLNIIKRPKGDNNGKY